MAVVSNLADVARLSFGEPVTIDVDLSKFDDDPDGPVALLDSPEYAKVLELEQAIESRFVALSAPVSDEVSVEFTDTHAVILSTVDREVTLGGDVRDGTAKLVAGEAKQRALTKETHGFVSVDGLLFARPQ